MSEQADPAPADPGDCIFCRIVAGEVPSEAVASTALTYAFRDVKPALPVHVLVVPRQHVVSADTVTAEHAEGLADRGYRLVFNVGDDARNSVAHLHMHVVGGRPMDWPPG